MTYYPIDISVLRPRAKPHAASAKRCPQVAVQPHRHRLHHATRRHSDPRRTPPGALHRIEHRQLRAGGGRCPAAQSAPPARPRRSAAARRRPCQGSRHAAARLQRCGRRHRGLQPQHPHPHQPRAGRRFPAASFQASRPLERARIADRDAPREPDRRRKSPFPLSTSRSPSAAARRIHTENSYKFTPDSVASLLTRSGFAVERAWTDAKNWFGVYLAEAV